MTNMARLTQFRTPTETEKPKTYQRSRLGKIAAAAGGAAALGGAYAYMRSRPAAVKNRFGQQLHEARLARSAKVKAPSPTPVAPKPVVPKPTAKPAAPKPAPSKLPPTSAPGQPVSSAPAPTTKPADLQPGDVVSSRTYRIPKGSIPPAAAPVAPPTRNPKLPAWATEPTKPKPPRNSRKKSKAEIASDEVAARHKQAETTKKKKAVQIIRRNLSLPPALRRKLISFQYRRNDGTYGVSTNPLSAYRKASRIAPWVSRASETAGDLGDMAAGKKVEKPFYKKSWFKRAALTAAIGAPLLANSLAISGQQKQRDGHKPRTGNTFGDRMDRVTHRAANVKNYLRGKVGLSTKLPKALLQFRATVNARRLVSLAARKSPIRLTNHETQFRALGRSGRPSSGPVLIRFATKRYSLPTARGVLKDLRGKAGIPTDRAFRASRPDASFSGVRGVFASGGDPLRPAVVVSRSHPLTGFTPVESAFHETGHLAGLLSRSRILGVNRRLYSGNTPPAWVLKYSNARGKITPNRVRSNLTREKEANREVLRAIQMRGSPAESATWRNAARKQMRKGYQSPTFRMLMGDKSHASQAGLNGERIPKDVLRHPGWLKKGKSILRKYPDLRAENTYLARGIARRLVSFAYADALDRGWDIRDARGRSARVYAPGAQKRDRREKTWGERTENLRLVRNIAIAGSLAGAGTAGYLAYRGKQNHRQTKRNYRKVISDRKTAEASARLAGKEAEFFRNQINRLSRQS